MIADSGIMPDQPNPQKPEVAGGSLLDSAEAMVVYLAESRQAVAAEYEPNHSSETIPSLNEYLPSRTQEVNAGQELATVIPLRVEETRASKRDPEQLRVEVGYIGDELQWERDEVLDYDAA